MRALVTALTHTRRTSLHATAAAYLLRFTAWRRRDAHPPSQLHFDVSARRKVDGRPNGVACPPRSSDQSLFARRDRFVARADRYRTRSSRRGRSEGTPQPVFSHAREARVS